MVLKNNHIPQSYVAVITYPCHKTNADLAYPLRAKFFRGNQNMYLRFMSFLHIDMIQVVEILHQVWQELTYST